MYKYATSKQYKLYVFKLVQAQHYFWYKVMQVHFSVKRKTQEINKKQDQHIANGSPWILLNNPNSTMHTYVLGLACLCSI